MELQITSGEGPHIQSYDNGTFVVDDNHYTGSICVQAEQSVVSWRPQSIEDLEMDDIHELVVANPGLVLLGTGTEIVFLSEKLFVPLYNANIGFEIMDTAAACRTYNLLMGEGRDVLAALLVG